MENMKVNICPNCGAVIDEQVSVYEVWQELSPCEEAPCGILKTRFLRGDFETADEQYEALMKLIRNCRFSGTKYHVFKDNRLINI